LLVEDEQALRTALEVRLRSEGYVVDIAEDGEEGLRKATNLCFDLIILDVMLPYRNGFRRLSRRSATRVCDSHSDVDCPRSSR